MIVVPSEFLRRLFLYHVEYTAPSEPPVGRLGPEVVVFDIHANVGTLFIEPDKLGVTSHSNFSTIKANACVFKGRWIYEVMIGSKGVMQLGWCTLNCKFSQEEGIGDTPDSYAYDGNRLRKWNIRTQKYGEAWLTGDVISCAIDCDEKHISFYRNGRCLGKAFTEVRFGRGLAYFPAVSLSMGENLRVNFGATPLRYPIETYRPLQAAPRQELREAQLLFVYFERLLPPLVEQRQLSPLPKPKTNDSISTRSTLLLMASQIFDKLAPLLRKAYIVESCLLKFMLKFCDARAHLSPQPFIEETLDLIWLLMQDFEYKVCLEYVLVSLLSAYRFSPVLVDFRYQQMYLILTLAVLRHGKTRRHLLKHVLFDKIKFPIFLHVKPPDEAGLVEMIPKVWWGFPKRDSDDEAEPETDEEQTRMKEYNRSCDALKQKVAVLEEIQVEILKVLIQLEDGILKPQTSRLLFMTKLREFIKENLDSGRVSMGHNQAPLPVTLCFFHRLVQALRYYWDSYHGTHRREMVNSKEAFVPLHRFFDSTLEYFDIQRLGGLITHLMKKHKDETKKALEDANAERQDYKDAESVYDRLTGLRALRLITRKPEKEKNRQQPSFEKSSLEQILDGVVLMYHIAAHKQLGKMCALRESMQEYIAAYDVTCERLDRCSHRMVEVRMELERSKSVFLEKISEQSRHMAWITSVIYAKDKQLDVYWLHQVSLRTIGKSDTGPLFSFLPTFYMDVCINTCSALRNFFHPTVSVLALDGYADTLHKFAIFLSNYSADTRIVNTDSKDTLIQALGAFVCFPTCLRALETIPYQNQKKLLDNLLTPYENRAWVQTSWILVKFWKGCGFAYRYSQLPHLNNKSGNKQPHAESLLSRVCPSPFYQNRVKEYFYENEDEAVKFIDSVLKQLNWAFSEFTTLLVEVQQYATRRIALDSRQCKICATCFDISVRLLRILEMVVHLAPDLFTDWTRPAAESLIARLLQLLCQVTNRVTSKTGIFDHVVSAELPGFESVDHFPILSAVMGIFLQLVMSGTQKSRDCATAALLAEPAFELAMFQQLLSDHDDRTTGADQSLGATAAPETTKVFPFQKYAAQCVDECELEDLQKMLNYLDKQLRQPVPTSVQPVIDEDLLCTICYDRQRSVVFKPCGHESCHRCINQHLMSRKDCFFCKTDIEKTQNIG